ncbi:hypothetical protein HDU83_007556 [Entophlyctis luteolus]|nr:hypothetical protein HDU83_007556 [Entophlyctis luteolus]KAJ3390345.1 hypothetical protein HDU84_007600 [Entophlyctis sp. JEL0112]
MSVTSDDVNYLVLRYLQESGFAHAAFAFRGEARVGVRSLKLPRVAPGALIAFLQKGLLYTEVEAHTLEDGSTKKCSVPFSLTLPHECIVDKDNDPSSNTGNNMTVDDDQNSVPAKDDDAGERASKSKSAKRERKEAKKADREKRARKESLVVDVVADEDEANIATASDITIYRASGEVGPVYCIAWNPRFMLLASGSQDGKVRLWRVPSDSSEGITTECAVTLDHSEMEENGVTSLDWHPQGLLIATGSVAGSVKIWTKSGAHFIQIDSYQLGLKCEQPGELKHTLSRHTSTVFTLKFNKKGDLLGTSSADSTVTIWDAYTGESRQQFQCHESAVLDLDWKDDITFATCGTDRSVYVCKMGMLEPLRSFSGHSADVNGLAWDSGNASGAAPSFLASCSDDCVIKVWTMETDSSPLFNLIGHKQEVFCLRWAPAGISPSAAQSGSVLNSRVLVSGSFDSTIRVWDTTTGKCLQVLEKHTSQVSALAFSADGCFLASGGFDHVVNIWRCRDWSLVKSFRGNGSVFEVCWGVKGDKVAACFNDGAVSVIHLASLREKI